jgi:hypothetical protein
MPGRPWIERAAPYSGVVSVLLLLILMVAFVWHLEGCDNPVLERRFNELDVETEAEFRHLRNRVQLLENRSLTDRKNIDLLKEKAHEHRPGAPD